MFSWRYIGAVIYMFFCSKNDGGIIMKKPGFYVKKILLSVKKFILLEDGSERARKILWWEITGGMIATLIFMIVYLIINGL